MAWAIALASLAGAGASWYAGDQAAKGGEKANAANLAAAQQNRDILLGMYEPSRALGYGAASDLATLYGYALPQYQTLDQLKGGASGAAPNLGKHASVGGASAAGGFSGPIEVAGRRGRTDYLNPAGVFGVGGSDNRAFGGTIDPTTGTVTLKNIKNPKKEAKREAAATAFLRGETDKLKGSKMRRIRETIDRMRDQGYAYNPNAQAEADAAAAEAEAAAANAPPAAGPAGEPGNFSRFFTSPDYQFRLSEGAKAIERSAAARGGLFSGAAGKALTRFGQDTASQEYGNYFERLMRMMGQGGAATNAAGGAVNQYTGQLIAGNNSNAAIRASSYGQQADAFNNLLGNLYYAYRRG